MKRREVAIYIVIFYVIHFVFKLVDQMFFLIGFFVVKRENHEHNFE